MKTLIINYILSRLKEASTWRGIIALITGGWTSLNPEQIEAIIPIALAIVGAIGVFLPDKKLNSISVDEEIEEEKKTKSKKTPSFKSEASKQDNEESGWGDK